MPDLILASSSPRRQELLLRLGVPFRVVPSALDEREPRPGEDPAAYARALAVEKGESVYQRFPDAVVLSADTVVAVDETILGKPVDSIDAWRMLALLRGRSHRVVTGVAIRGPLALDSSVEASVVMTAYDDQALSAYVASGEPMDKAGAYAVQGEGGALVESVRGCLDTVIGLPLCRCAEYLLASGFEVDHGIACGCFLR